MATMHSTAIPTPKRFIWAFIHGSVEPPATEYNIRKPVQAIATNKMTIGQLI
jgi:hypothetical protein